MKNHYSLGMQAGKLIIFKNHKFAVLILQDVKLGNYAVEKLNEGSYVERDVTNLMRLNIADATCPIGIWN